jgi:hypothetical protein
MPDGPLVAPDDPDYETWAVSPDDIVPVDDDWPMAPAGLYDCVSLFNKAPNL